MRTHNSSSSNTINSPASLLPAFFGLLHIVLLSLSLTLLFVCSALLAFVVVVAVVVA